MSSSDPAENPNDQDGSELQVVVQGLYRKIIRACRYTHENQELSCQAVAMVLAQVIQEVSGDWWADELEDSLHEAFQQGQDVALGREPDPFDDGGDDLDEDDLGLGPIVGLTRPGD